MHINGDTFQKAVLQKAVILNFNMSMISTITMIRVRACLFWSLICYSNHLFLVSKNESEVGLTQAIGDSKVT